MSSHVVGTMPRIQKQGKAATPLKACTFKWLVLSMIFWFALEAQELLPVQPQILWNSSSGMRHLVQVGDAKGSHSCITLSLGQVAEVAEAISTP